MDMIGSGIVAVITYSAVAFCGFKTYLKTKKCARSERTKELQQKLTIMMIFQVLYCV